MKWDEFRLRYFDEIRGRPDVVAVLCDMTGDHEVVTFRFRPRDEDHNNTVALKEFLESRVRPRRAHPGSSTGLRGRVTVSERQAECRSWSSGTWWVSSGRDERWESGSPCCLALRDPLSDFRWGVCPIPGPPGKGCLMRCFPHDLRYRVSPRSLGTRPGPTPPEGSVSRKGRATGHDRVGRPRVRVGIGSQGLRLDPPILKFSGDEVPGLSCRPLRPPMHWWSTDNRDPCPARS